MQIYNCPFNFNFHFTFIFDNIIKNNRANIRKRVYEESKTNIKFYTGNCLQLTAFSFFQNLLHRLQKTA